MALNTRIQTKRDTAANWEAKNPVLLDGEMIIVITNAGDTRFKIGDGTKTYTQLPFQDESLYNALSGKADSDHKHDLATTTTAGMVMVDGTAGIGVNTENGNLFVKEATTSEIDDKQHSYKPITPNNLDYAVKAALVDNANELSETERENALSWLCAMSNISKSKSSGDVTDLLGSDNCRYMFTSSVTGMPFDGEWWFVDVYGSGYTDITIVAYPVLVDTDRTFAHMYIKTCANGVWGNWQEVVTRDNNGYINSYGFGATNRIVVDNGEKAMAIYPNGIGSERDGNVWIDYAGDAYFTDVYVNQKKAATEEYVTAAIEAAFANIARAEEVAF